VFKIKRKIILASTSPRRKGLLQQIGLEFDVVPSSYEENMDLKLSPKKMVQLFAEGKAVSVASKIKKGIVIGVDTIIVFNNEKLGKPLTDKKAIDLLRDISGKEINVYSGICIIDIENKKKIIDYEISKIKLKKLTKEEIQNYVKTGEPLDKAGGFAIQGMGGIFVEKIEGCHSNIIGLPLYNLYKNLKKLDVNIFEYDCWIN
jgi:septum formation protein